MKSTRGDPPLESEGLGDACEGAAKAVGEELSATIVVGVTRVS